MLKLSIRVFKFKTLHRSTRTISSQYKSKANLKNLTESARLSKLREMALPQSRSDPKILTLSSPEFHSIFSDELKTLASMFDKYGHEIRIAGGAVRDLLMKIRPTDLDFATTATPTEMKDMFTKENVRMINMNGEKHGTITPRINDKENFEVTTLRIDVVTDGRHAEVQFTTDWLLDALRRDLTINSMFLGLDGSVYDYFYGFDDLEKRKVRFVGDANTRIQEDYLRILRYFRFYGKIAPEPDNHDPETLAAIKSNRQGLENVSGERIWVELKKTLEGPHFGALLRKIIDCELGALIGLPKNPNLAELELVLGRISANNLKLNPITVLAALLNGIDDVVALNARLKLSAFERDLALFVVEHRETKLHEKPLMPYQQLVLRGKKIADTVQYVVEVLSYNSSPFLDEFRAWQVPKFPVSGNALKEAGVESGKFMGAVLKELKNIWMDSDFKLDEQDLLREVPAILERLSQHKKRNK